MKKETGAILIAFKRNFKEFNMENLKELLVDLDNRSVSRDRQVLDKVFHVESAVEALSKRNAVLEQMLQDQNSKLDQMIQLVTSLRAR